MRPRIVIVVTLYALVAAFTVTAYALYIPQYTFFGDRGWGTKQVAGGPVLVTVLYESNPSAGQLRVGDEVVALDGEDIGRDDSRLESAYRRRMTEKPGEPYRMTVRRDGELREVTLRTRVTPARETLLSPTALVTFLYNLSFLAVG
ncbi:MAG TPA: PDZ domain-containing protein, partial [Pyrinomonadaceae bacterium]|nr:PDZ domain-containing protein [Pyrinomonadaceae bacterium]